MQPSSLGGGRILRRTLSVVCLSVRLSVRPVIVAIGNVFSSTASVTDVLFGTHWGPHIVRPSRCRYFLEKMSVRHRIFNRVYLTVFTFAWRLNMIFCEDVTPSIHGC